MMPPRSPGEYAVRNRHVVLTGLVAAVSTAVIFFGAWLWAFIGPGGFIEGKSILASLQGLEVQHRQQQIRTPDLFGTYHDTGPVIVLATRDHRFPYAWIAATVPSCDGQLCMVSGYASIDITCNDLSRLTTRVALAPPVLRLLKNSCRGG